MSVLINKYDQFDGESGGSDEESDSKEGSSSEEESGSESDEETDSEESEDENEDSNPQSAKEEMENIDSDGNGERESCPICLAKFMNQKLGTPENCEHTFCFECIQEWSKNINTCPIDRNEFNYIHLRKSCSKKILQKIKVDVLPKEPENSLHEDVTLCEVCHRGDREDRLLLCDACDLAYHCECLNPPLFHIPIDEWFCPPCSRVLKTGAMAGCSTPRSRRVIPRTRASETVRNRVQNLRTAGSSSTRKVGSKTPQRRRRRRTYKRSYKKVVQLARTKKDQMGGSKGKTCGKGSTVVVTYHRRRRRKRRKVKPKKIKMSATQEAYIKSAQTRIAKRLGLCKSSTNSSIPDVKMKTKSNSTSLEKRSSVSIFGKKDELIEFSDNEKQDIPVSTKSTNKSSNSSITSQRNQQIPQASSSNLLDTILASQKLLHSKPKDVIIQTDGSLSLKKNSKSINNVKSNSVTPSSSKILSSAKNGAIPKQKVTNIGCKISVSNNKCSPNSEFKRPFDPTLKSTIKSCGSSNSLISNNKISQSSANSVKMSAAKKALWGNTFVSRGVEKPFQDPSQEASKDPDSESQSSDSASDFIRKKRLMFYSASLSIDKSNAANKRESHNPSRSTNSHCEENVVPVQSDLLQSASSIHSTLQETSVSSSDKLEADMHHSSDQDSIISSKDVEESESDQENLDLVKSQNLIDFTKKDDILNNIKIKEEPLSDDEHSNLTRASCSSVDGTECNTSKNMTSGELCNPSEFPNKYFVDHQSFSKKSKRKINLCGS